MEEWITSKKHNFRSLYQVFSACLSRVNDTGYLLLLTILVERIKTNLVIIPSYRGTLVSPTAIYQTKCPFTVTKCPFLFFQTLPYDSRLFPGRTMGPCFALVFFTRPFLAD